MPPASELILELDLRTGLWLLGALVLGGLLGWLFTQLRATRRIASLEARAQAAEEARRAEQEHEHAFAALSRDALDRNSRSFLDLAHQTLREFHSRAQGDLAMKEKSIEQMLKPVRETLDRTHASLERIERERREAHGALNQHLQSLVQSQQALQGETRNLVQALRRPEVRGQWGELTLRRLVELAGMVEHCDFEEQVHQAGEDGTARPDMIVHLPGGRNLVIDVKTPLDAYLSAVEAADDGLREQHLASHARKLRERVRELSRKQYWTRLKSTPEFVVLFVPGDQFLSAALERDPALLEDAMRDRVVLATPTSLVALLRAIAYGWRQEALAANAERIREVGEEFYTRLATLTEHLARLGKSLDNSVNEFNRVVGSFESRVLPAAQRFQDLGIDSRKQVETPPRIERGAREPTSRD